LNLLRTYAFICTTFIILNKQTLDQIKGNTVHLLSKPYFLASYTFLVKHHQNSKAKLLHHRYLEQNSSEVKLSHAKHVEQIYSKRLQLKVDSQNTVSGYQHVHPEYLSKKKVIYYVAQEVQDINPTGEWKWIGKTALIRGSTSMVLAYIWLALYWSQSGGQLSFIRIELNMHGSHHHMKIQYINRHMTCKCKTTRSKQFPRNHSNHHKVELNQIPEEAKEPRRKQRSLLQAPSLQRQDNTMHLI
jgi:hypothetical protein